METSVVFDIPFLSRTCHPCHFLFLSSVFKQGLHETPTKKHKQNSSSRVATQHNYETCQRKWKSRKRRSAMRCFLYLCVFHGKSSYQGTDNQIRKYLFIKGPYILDKSLAMSWKHYLYLQADGSADWAH